MVSKIFVIALFALIYVQPSFQAWDWLAYDDDSANTDVDSYQHHRLDYFDTVGLDHKKKLHPKAHAPAHAKHHAKHHAKPHHGKPHHAALKAHADPHATIKKASKIKHKKPIPPKKILDTSDEDDDEDDDDDDNSKLEHTKGMDGKTPDLTKSESDVSSSEGMKTTVKTTTEEEFRKARIRDKYDEMNTQTPKKKSCCDKHKNSVPEEGGVLDVKQEDNDPTQTEKVGYFRRMGRFFKNLFTWRTEDE